MVLDLYLCLFVFIFDHDISMWIWFSVLSKSRGWLIDVAIVQDPSSYTAHCVHTFAMIDMKRNCIFINSYKNQESLILSTVLRFTGMFHAHLWCDAIYDWRGSYTRLSDIRTVQSMTRKRNATHRHVPTKLFEPWSGFYPTVQWVNGV